MHGMVDNDGSVQGRFNYGWTPQNTSKMSLQVCLRFRDPQAAR